jgi:hypothetical protein
VHHSPKIPEGVDLFHYLVVAPQLRGCDWLGRCWWW